MSMTPDRLYDLLPAIYRKRDFEQGEPLRALLQVIAEQAGVVEKDIAQLYENWFIETCQDWVVPYIGELVGYEPVHAAGQPSEARTPRDRSRNRILTPRSEVANTIRNRRRKGALYLLELLAQDVANWPARAVEFFQNLSFTQHVQHLKPNRGGTVNLRNGDAFDRINGPFDELAHTIDVRRPNSTLTRGRYNIPSVGLFVWRLQSYKVTEVLGFHLDEKQPQHCFTFSSLGNDMALFNHPEREEDETRIEAEIDLPVPIRRKAMFGESKVTEQPEAYHVTIASEQYYGEKRSIAIHAEGWPEEQTEKHLIPRERVIMADLANWVMPPNLPARDYVALDPERGRLMFPKKHYPSKLWLTYFYGGVTTIGGGEYKREMLEPSAHALSLSWFRNYDFKAPQELIARLKTPRETFSNYLKKQLAPTTLRLLQAADETRPPEEALLSAVAADLNTLLQGGSLYSAEDENHNKIFKTVAKNDKIEALDELERELQANRQSLNEQEIIRRNRLLLESAFAEDFATSYVLYKVGANAPITTLEAALAAWQKDAPRYGIIEIVDSGVYSEQPIVEMRPGQTLQLRAANGRRPVIRMINLNFSGPDAMVVRGAKDSRFIMDGLWLVGRGVYVKNEMAELEIRHCTLVPGWSLEEDGCPRNAIGASLQLVEAQARVKISHSIVGIIQVDQSEVQTEPMPFTITDSVIDAMALTRAVLSAGNCEFAHVALEIKRSTVFGHVHVHAITLAENSLFMSLVTVARRQIGCMRFCYVTPSLPIGVEPPQERSRTPRRFNCQPDLAKKAVREKIASGEIAAALEEQALRGESLRVRPQFNSSSFGAPEYCQLAHSCAQEIKRGADDESEMGVYHDLYQPQRETNLRIRLDEYTPAGMDAGIFFVN